MVFDSNPRGLCTKTSSFPYAHRTVEGLKLVPLVRVQFVLFQHSGYGIDEGWSVVIPTP